MRAIVLAASFMLVGCEHGFGGDSITLRQFSPAVSLQDATRFEQYATFSPDGTEYYLSVADADWNYRGILRSVRRDGVWLEYSPLPFVWGDGQDGGEPFVSADGLELLFVSARASSAVQATGVAGSAEFQRAIDFDVYIANRCGTGWCDPVRLGSPINSTANEWHPTLAADGTLCFASERGNSNGKADIFCARRDTDGSFHTVERLAPPVNLESANDSDPFIAPDRSYLIFHSDRPGGFGEHDLYIAFARSDGGWSEPRNLGPKINSAAWEMGPHVTGDGLLLLFTRREAIKTEKPSRIYAVDASRVTRR